MRQTDPWRNGSVRMPRSGLACSRLVLVTGDIVYTYPCLWYYMCLNKIHQGSTAMEQDSSGLSAETAQAPENDPPHLGLLSALARAVKVGLSSFKSCPSGETTRPKLPSYLETRFSLHHQSFASSLPLNVPRS